MDGVKPRDVGATRFVLAGVLVCSGQVIARTTIDVPRTLGTLPRNWARSRCPVAGHVPLPIRAPNVPGYGACRRAPSSSTVLPLLVLLVVLQYGYCWFIVPTTIHTLVLYSLHAPALGTLPRKVRGQLPAAHRILMTLRIDLSRSTS